MKKQVLFIHSAGAQGPHQGSSDLAEYLQKGLGAEYNLLYLKIANPENPEYSLWKAQLEKEFTKLNSEVVLVGHSLGGSVLLKYSKVDWPTVVRSAERLLTKTISKSHSNEEFIDET